MVEVADEHFEQIIADAIDALPERIRRHMNNVAVVYQDEPSQKQRQELHLVNGMTLFGLYQGIPLPVRGSNYNLVLPDKITIFKRPMEQTSNSLAELQEQVYHTVWHEMAHHFGLDHDRIHELE